MEKILEKSGKSQGILSVWKSGNPENYRPKTNKGTLRVINKVAKVLATCPSNGQHSISSFTSL